MPSTWCTERSLDLVVCDDTWITTSSAALLSSAARSPNTMAADHSGRQPSLRRPRGGGRPRGACRECASEDRTSPGGGRGGGGSTPLPSGAGPTRLPASCPHVRWYTQHHGKAPGRTSGPLGGTRHAAAVMVSSRRRLPRRASVIGDGIVEQRVEQLSTCLRGADDVDPLPATLPKLLACWTEHVIGQLPALKSITSRIITGTHDLLGAPSLSSHSRRRRVRAPLLSRDIP